jgi:hypothetical protein
MRKRLFGRIWQSSCVRWIGTSGVLSRRKRASEDLDTIRIFDMERAWYNFKE